MKQILRKFHGIIHKKKLLLDDKEGFKKYIEILNPHTSEIQKVTLVLDKYKKPRSVNQNSYYWGVVIKLLADEIGYTDEEMHEAIKWEFLRKKGVKFPTVRSTASLSTVEFEDLMSKIRMWASKEMGIYVPTPNEAGVL